MVGECCKKYLPNRICLWTGHGKVFQCNTTNTSLNVSYNSMKGDDNNKVFVSFLASGWSFVKVTVSYPMQVLCRIKLLQAIEEIKLHDLPILSVHLCGKLHSNFQLTIIGDNWRFNAPGHSYNEVADDNCENVFADVGVTYKHGQMGITCRGTICLTA